jgi:multidrug efflux pump subunit AcrA (membrane-fusion protein)
VIDEAERHAFTPPRADEGQGGGTSVAAPAKPPVPLFAPQRPHTSHRLRTSASLLLALILLLALAFVVKSAFLSGPPAFPAVVQPAVASSLDFENTGVLTALDAYPGQSVQAGQVIATQSTQLAQLHLAYDQSVLAADKQSLAALQSSSSSKLVASQNQVYQRNLQIQLAEQELAAAQNELRVATTPQQQVAAQAAITEAQTRLALAAAQIVSSTGSAGSAIGGIQAAIARDQAQIAADQLQIQEGTLTAPLAGVIASVSGAVGELVGPDGVISPTPNGASVPVEPSFQLFPPAAQAPAVRPNGSFTPIVTMYEGTDWEVIAQVPQAQIESIHTGQWATLSVNGDSRRFRARVSHIQLTPIVQNGTVSYDVLLTLMSKPTGLMAGMAGTVSLDTAGH